MQIQVNGEAREIDPGTNLLELSSLLTLKPEQIAIELNRLVIRRSDWQATVLNEQDVVEIVHFVGGG